MQAWYAPLRTIVAKKIVITDTTTIMMNLPNSTLTVLDLQRFLAAIPEKNEQLIEIHAYNGGVNLLTKQIKEKVHEQ
jgi:hypothetical protein